MQVDIKRGLAWMEKRKKGDGGKSEANIHETLHCSSENLLNGWNITKLNAMMSERTKISCDCLNQKVSLET